MTPETTRHSAEDGPRAAQQSGDVAIEVFSEAQQIAKAHGRIGAWVCDKWRLSELLGIGGMGAVYAARHRNGKPVAIKIMHLELVRSEDARERFQTEAFAANKVAHPGAASVLDDGITEDGSPFLVMDLLKGTTLSHVLQETGVVEPLQLLSWMDQLLEVLAVAHGKGIVHRDFKPENLLVNAGGPAYLLDFGIALVPGAPEKEPTHARCTLGTPNYMPPEQALGLWNDIDGRTDLWAVGATMFWALSGHHVQCFDVVEERRLGATGNPARSLGVVAPNLPAAVIALVDRALRFDKEARWVSARSMRMAVVEILTRLGERPSPSVRSPQSVHGSKAVAVLRSSEAPNWGTPSSVHPETTTAFRPPKILLSRWRIPLLLAIPVMATATWLLLSGALEPVVPEALGIHLQPPSMDVVLRTARQGLLAKAPDDDSERRSSASAPAQKRTRLAARRSARDRARDEKRRSPAVRAESGESSQEHPAAVTRPASISLPGGAKPEEPRHDDANTPFRGRE